ncbi:MAG TPA: M23 family metallopeptidase [Dehalococcoidia bacterium]|nr:M23 family metallopeptidase [Dehalococcoidia bacterium]
MVFVIALVLAFSSNGGGGDDDGVASAAGEQGAVDAADAGAVADDETVIALDPEGDEPVVDDAADQALNEPEAPVEAPDSPADPALEPGNEPEEVIDPVVEPDLTGFIVPIDGACLSEFEGHLPGSPREYRNGTHEGFDMYGWASCRTIDQGTAVLAARAGTVVRIDHLYLEITVAQFEEATDPALGLADESTQDLYLDRLRGRQVWIDHGDGVLTRYAHLSAVAAGLDVDDPVRAGQVVGFIGESGQLESITAPGTDLHLHFEIRVGDRFLGEGLAPQEARALYLEAFGLTGG